MKTYYQYCFFFSFAHFNFFGQNQDEIHFFQTHYMLENLLQLQNMMKKKLL